MHGSSKDLWAIEDLTTLPAKYLLKLCQGEFDECLPQDRDTKPHITDSSQLDLKTQQADWLQSQRVYLDIQLHGIESKANNPAGGAAEWLNRELEQPLARTIGINMRVKTLMAKLVKALVRFPESHKGGSREARKLSSEIWDLVMDLGKAFDDI